MANATVDLWPEIAVDVTIVTPVTILKQQAALLGQKTGNLVEARISSSGNDRGEVEHHFVLFGPILNYSYGLFSIRHDLECYPLVLNCELLSSSPMEIKDQQHLEEGLRDIFSHEKTLRVIQSIIAQSKA